MTSETLKTVEKKLDSVMNMMLRAMKTKECTKNWTRLEAFFQCLLDIGKSSLTAS